MDERDSFTTIIRNPTGIPINKNGHDGSWAVLTRTPLRRILHNKEIADANRELLGKEIARRDSLARIKRGLATCLHVGDFDAA